MLASGTNFPTSGGAGFGAANANPAARHAAQAAAQAAARPLPTTPAIFTHPPRTGSPTWNAEAGILVPLREIRPKRPQRLLEPPADEDRPVLLRHAPGVEMDPRALDVVADLPEPLERILKHDQDVAVEVARPP